MTFRFCSSVLFVKDIKRSRSFYEAVLGQKVEIDFGPNVSFGCFSLWQADHAFELIHRNAGRAIGTGDQFELYFETPDIDRAHEIVGNEGVALATEMSEQPWGQRAFRFYDPDHYLVEVGEDMSAVNVRLFRSGMSIAEIVAKTSLPEQVVRADIEKGR